jgi:hypothetical protein
MTNSCNSFEAKCRAQAAVLERGAGARPSANQPGAAVGHTAIPTARAATTSGIGGSTKAAAASPSPKRAIEHIGASLPPLKAPKSSGKGSVPARAATVGPRAVGNVDAAGKPQAGGADRRAAAASAATSSTAAIGVTSNGAAVDPSSSLGSGGLSARPGTSNALPTSTPGKTSAASASEELAEKLRCQLLGGDGASSGESDGGLSNPKSFKFQPLESMPCTFHFAWDTTRGDWTAAIPLMRNSKWRIEDSPQNYKLIWPGSSKRDVWKLCMDDAARVEFEANLRTQCEEFVANCTASVRIPRTAIFPGPFVLALMCSVQAVVKALFEKLHDDRSYRRIWTDAMKAKRTMPPPSAREQ